MSSEQLHFELGSTEQESNEQGPDLMEVRFDLQFKICGPNDGYNLCFA